MWFKERIGGFPLGEIRTTQFFFTQSPKHSGNDKNTHVAVRVRGQRWATLHLAGGHLLPAIISEILYSRCCTWRASRRVATLHAMNARMATRGDRDPSSRVFEFVPGEGFSIAVASRGRRERDREELHVAVFINIWLSSGRCLEFAGHLRDSSREKKRETGETR